MDVAEPGRALAPGLTVAILRALSARSTPVTAAHLSRIMDNGTEAGVRRAVERLTLHGVCLREEVADRTMYSLNDDHVLSRAVAELVRADGELVRRLRRTLLTWDPAPVSAVLFGSAARRDGDLDSDIDVLLVRPVLRTERHKQVWAQQARELRAEVARWTGNQLQVVDRSRPMLRALARHAEPIVDELLDDGILLCGIPVRELVGAA